jgi:hypothetical protein
MSELRKHLQHSSLDEPLIKTHYRLGYSLILVAKTLDINQTTPVLPSQKKASAKKRLLILCSSVVVLALTLSVYWYTQPQETTLPSPDFQLSVVENDLIDAAEVIPIFSDNKEYLASTRLYSKVEVKKVHVRRLSDNKEISLTHTKYTEFTAMGWQNQQDKLIIRGYNKALNECEYLLADISNFDAPPKYSSIKPCNQITDWYATLDKEGRFFYFTSADNEQKRSALLRFDLKTKREVTLVPAKSHSYGPQLPRLSLDGKRLAYIVWGDKGDGYVRVYVNDLSTLDKTLVYKSIHFRFSYAMDWVNNNTIRYIDRDQILTFDTNEYKLIHSSSLPRFVSPQYITHRSPTDIYFTTRERQHRQIKQIDRFNESSKVYSLFESKQNSDNIQYDNTHHNYYFASSRSGNEQIWMGNQLGIKQLTDFKDPDTDLLSLRVSPNGKYLLYYRDKKQLEILIINTGNIRKLNEFDVNHLELIRWGPDSDSLFYIDKRENYQVKLYDLSTQQHKMFATLVNTSKLFTNNKGIPFAVAEKGLINLITNDVYPLPSNVHMTHTLKFAQVGDYFYAADRDYRFYRWKKNEKTADVVNSNHLTLSMVITDNHELILTTQTARNVKIERLSWSLR